MLSHKQRVKLQIRYNLDQLEHSLPINIQFSERFRQEIEKYATQACTTISSSQLKRIRDTHLRRFSLTYPKRIECLLIPGHTLSRGSSQFQKARVYLLDDLGQHHATIKVTNRSLKTPSDIDLSYDSIIVDAQLLDVKIVTLVLKDWLKEHHPILSQALIIWLSKLEAIEILSNSVAQIASGYKNFEEMTSDAMTDYND